MHVRRAVNYALNKDGIRKAYGGELRGDIATSVEPPTVLPNSTSIDPYGSAANPQGQPDKAAEEMKQSRYDLNKDGVCNDGGACDNILFLVDEASGIPEQVFQVAEGAQPPLTVEVGLYRGDTGARLPRSDTQGSSVTLAVP